MDKHQCPWCYLYTVRPTEEEERGCPEFKCDSCGKISYQPPPIPKEKLDKFFQQQQSLAVQAQ